MSNQRRPALLKGHIRNLTFRGQPANLREYCWSSFDVNRVEPSCLEWMLQYGMTNYKQPTARKGKELFIANYDIRALHQQQMVFIMERRG